MLGDLKKRVINPMYTGKGECKDYIGISMLSIVGEVYGRIIIKFISRIIDEMGCQAMCGFNPRRGCVNKVFFPKKAGTGERW